MAGSTGSRVLKPSQVPPLRQKPFEPDGHDSDRHRFLVDLWHAQDEQLRGRDRQIEENVRMLLGQQWIVWSDLRQRYIDIADTLSDDERRWRHMPTLNEILLWWVQMKARMTENPPVLSWQPGPDRRDAILAEVCDPIFKYVWRDAQANTVLDRLVSWLIPAGQMHWKSVINPNKGDYVSSKGPAVLTLLDADGDPVGGENGPIQRSLEDVPYGADGKPAAQLKRDANGNESLEQLASNGFREGGIDLELLTPMEVRGEPGASREWHQKAYHLQMSLVTPQQAYERLGIELEADVQGRESEGTASLLRLLHGSGLWGAAEGKGSTLSDVGSDGFVTLYEGWWAPGRLEGTECTPTQPGGRLMVVTGSGQVLRDGPRTAHFRHVSPIRCFSYLTLPGRSSGSSPQESINGPVRTRNRLHGQIHGVATLQGNPIQVQNLDVGLKEGEVTNRPGQIVRVSRTASGNAPVIEFIAPPALGKDVYEAADRLRDTIERYGHMRGQEGNTPTRNASGDLVEELRYNSDRPIGPTMRDIVAEIGRTGEDWLAMVPTIWDEEKIIQIAGEDGIARTITVLPDMFTGASVNVEPSVESMLPEGRGERQSRVERFWQQGVYGDPVSPKAINRFLDEARFPHMSRAVRPGGPDRSMAEQNVGKLLQGTPAKKIPVFEWYDQEIHIDVLEQFMKSPEYLKLDIGRQQEFVLHRTNLIGAYMAAQQLQAMRLSSVTAGALQAADVAEAASQPPPAPPGMGPPAAKAPAAQLSRTSSATA